MNRNTDPQRTIIIIMYAIAILWKVRLETLYSSKAKEVYLELSILSLGSKREREKVLENWIFLVSFQEN
jgi:hypothetical protein